MKLHQTIVEEYFDNVCCNVRQKYCQSSDWPQGMLSWEPGILASAKRNSFSLLWALKVCSQVTIISVQLMCSSRENMRQRFEKLKVFELAQTRAMHIRHNLETISMALFSLLSSRYDVFYLDYPLIESCGTFACIIKAET
jgi:hypothetical protein